MRYVLYLAVGWLQASNINGYDIVNAANMHWVKFQEEFIEANKDKFIEEGGNRYPIGTRATTSVNAGIRHLLRLR